MKKVFKKRNFILLAALLVIAVGTVIGTTALLTAHADSVVNTFAPADVTTHINEEFSGTVKSNDLVRKYVTIENDGPTNAFIRARITVTPERVLSEGEIELKGMSDTWVDGGDGFYYYTVVTSPDSELYDVTDPIMTSVKLNELTQNFDIVVYQEATMAREYNGGDVVSADTIKAAFADMNTGDLED